MKPLRLFILLCLLLLLTDARLSYAQPTQTKATSAPARFDIRRPANWSAVSRLAGARASSLPFRFSIQPRKRSIATSYALFVANEEYDADEFRSLPDATFDAEVIGGLLKNQFGFRTKQLKNTTYNNLDSELEELNKRSWKPYEQLLIYISGHGDEKNGQGYLIMKDSDKDSRNTYFPLSYLKSLIERHTCPHIMLVLDICYGGAINPTPRLPNAPVCEEQRNNLNAYFSCMLKSRTRLYISSGSLTVVQGGRNGENSPFTKSLEKKLSETVHNPTKTLSATELREYLKKDNPQMTFSSEADGDFLFVVNNQQ